MYCLFVVVNVVLRLLCVVEGRVIEEAGVIDFLLIERILIDVVSEFC